MGEARCEARFAEGSARGGAGSRRSCACLALDGKLHVLEHLLQLHLRARFQLLLHLGQIHALLLVIVLVRPLLHLFDDARDQLLFLRADGAPLGSGQA